MRRPQNGKALRRANPAIGHVVNVPKTSLLLVAAAHAVDGRVVDDDRARGDEVEPAAYACPRVPGGADLARGA